MHLPEEGLKAFALWIGKNVLGRAFLDDQALIHEEHAVRHLARKSNFMCDEHHGATLVRELPWPTFVPDEDHEIVVGGLGELHGLDTLAAASTADGKTLVAYAPSRRTLTIDFSKLTGSQWAGYWWDPTSGRRVDIPAMNGGRRVTLETPFDEDAALVLHAD